MADPIITLRPFKTVNSYQSNWNSAHLPIHYEITNDKFPVSSLDTELTISSVTDNNGYFQVSFTADHSFVENQYVFLNSTNYPNKIAVVRELTVDTATVILDLPYISNETGTARAYYNNYVTEVDVYTGINGGHPHAGSNPMTKLTTIQLRPYENITTVDVSRYVKTELQSIYDDSQSSFPNDLNAWVDFYIVVREKYQTLKGGSFTTSSDVNDGANIFHAVNNANQFGNFYGGNLYGQVVSNDVNAPVGKFLTNFEVMELVLGGGAFSISLISEVDTFDLKIEQYNTNSALLASQNNTFSGDGYGVYHLPVDVEFENDCQYLLVSIVSGGDVYSEVKRINYNTELCVDVTEAPTGLIATLVGTNDVRVSWSDNSFNEEKFEIYRSLDGVSFSKIAEVGEDIDFYDDNGLTTDSTYYYKVRAIGKDGTISAFSNVASIYIPVAFISEWNTTNTTTGSTGSNAIALPLVASGTYNFTVFWGDGNSDVITSWNQPEVSHSYSSFGTYTVSIVGTLQGWKFDNSGDRNKLLNISSWGGFNSGNQTNVFYGCENLDVTATDALNTTGITTLQGFLRGCSSLTGTADFNNWDVSNITDLSSMFEEVTLFNQPLDNWNVSNVVTFLAMFSGSDFDQDITGWVTSSASNMSRMFERCPFNQNINGWDVSGVTNFATMFRSNQAFNQNLTSWNTSSATNMAAMFQNADAFNGDISGFDVSNVTSFFRMFSDNSGFNQSLDSWTINTSQDVDMTFMFLAALNFNGNITSWNVSRVTNMFGMFRDSNFNQNISGWNTQNVTRFQDMFRDSPFNQNLGSWNIQSLTNATNMFFGDFDLSTANLDSLLIGWAAQAPNVQNNVVFGAPETSRTSASDAAVTLLTGTYGWTINTL